MKAEHFVAAHLPSWQRLNELVDKSQKRRLNSLSDEELHEMGSLYRRVSSDLARAQTRLSGTIAGRELVRSLNDLVLRAHTQVYSAPQPEPGRILRFLMYGFPAAVRRQWRAIALATVLTYLPALLAYGAVVINPAMGPLLVDPRAIHEVHLRAQHHQITGWGANTTYNAPDSPETSGMIMTNNIRVTASAVAYGLTMGIGTALVLISNGIMLGALGGVATNSRISGLFWAVIVPHGVIELSCICMAGGAGFLLARAIFAPGDVPRLDALKLAGTEAARIVVGVSFLLVIAGTIEGFFTPMPLDPAYKISFGICTGIALLLYLGLKPSPAAGKK